MYFNPPLCSLLLLWYDMQLIVLYLFCLYLFIPVRAKTLGKKSHAGLYRDDGLIYLENAKGPLISKIEKALHRIFKRNQLKISMEQTGHTVNFLDVTMSTDGTHKPYKKPNSSLKYVNRSSNHPPSIPKNILSSIQKRLNTISSSEEVFNEAKAAY